MNETIAAVRSALRLLEDQGGEPELCAALAAGLERIDEREREVKRMEKTQRMKNAAWFCWGFSAAIFFAIGSRKLLYWLLD